MKKGMVLFCLLCLLLCACGIPFEEQTSDQSRLYEGIVAYTESGSNLLSAEEASKGEESHVEVPDKMFADLDYDLVFYWRMTASQGPWYLQIAPMESEEWHDFRHGKDEAWAGCCNYGEHGFTLLEKYCMNFDSEAGDLYQIRCVSEGDPEWEDGSVIWQVQNIPITGVDTMLTKGLSVGYSGWENGRLIIMVDKMEYCRVCPSTWRPKNP